jgi:hypothetical protein
MKRERRSTFHLLDKYPIQFFFQLRPQHGSGEALVIRVEYCGVHPFIAAYGCSIDLFQHLMPISYTT